MEKLPTKSDRNKHEALIKQFMKLNPAITQHFSKSEVQVIEKFYSDTKIKDFKANSEVIELEKTILAVTKFAGISPAPDKDHREMVVAFIMEKFGDFSIPEIKEAFMKALSMEMAVDDIATYNKLSAQWIAGVLQKYRSMRGKLILKYENDAQRIANEKPLSDAEIDHEMKLSASMSFREYKQNGELVDIGNAIYNWLWKKGLVPQQFAHEHFTDQAKEQLLVQMKTKQRKANVIHHAVIGSMIEELERGNSSAIELKSKKIALSYFYEHLATSSKDINELI